jgi:hypothetical protein
MEWCCITLRSPTFKIKFPIVYVKHNEVIENEEKNKRGKTNITFGNGIWWQ